MDSTPLDRAIQAVGSAKALAEALGVTKQAITGWRHRGVPPERVLAVERLTGGTVTRHELRPDIFGYPQEAGANV
jgi:DNA-binding transcriptional regulator YdaS (Cro superfamily)